MASGSENESFLERLAAEIRASPPEIGRVVVLPNKRSLFTLKALLPADDATIQFFTADQFVEAATGVKLIEAEELLVTFYQAYKRIERQPQPFDEFSKWAITLLRDFNETDLSLADPVMLFDFIHAYHKTGEGFADGEAGRVEAAFLSFWERIPGYYDGLRKELKKLDLAYRGMLYRQWAEEKPFEELTSKTLYWVGLVPGNPAERLALEKLDGIAKVKVYADTDAYYLNQSKHEAGRLFRSDKLFKNHQWTIDRLGKERFVFKEIPVPGQVAQVQQARSIVSAIPKNEWHQTALVLLDEQLLGPLLDQLRNVDGPVNVTMGYPLRGTQIHRFVMSLIQLHAGTRRMDKSKAFYHLHLEAMLQFQVVQDWFDQSMDWKVLQREIIAGNFKFIPLEWLRERLVQDLFGSDLFDLLFDWPLEAEDVFQRIGNVLEHWKEQVKRSRDRLEKLAIAAYIERLKLLIAQFNDVIESSDYRELRKFVHRQVGYSKLHFEEPENNALQVMGMLETRLLDFKNLILVGASENQLPGSAHRHTFVPYMHRQAFKMPTTGDTEALMAYHFYRLLQRSEKAWFVYNNVSDAFNSGEPSPYLLQIREELRRENPSLEYSVESLIAPTIALNQKELAVKKDDQVLEDLKSFLQRKVSPSSINTYVNSPLEFYFYYVLGLREQEQVEEEVEASTLGSIVHEVLEELYKPFVGKLVDVELLKKSKGSAKERVQEAFLEKFPEEEITKGKNYLRVAMAVKFVEQFIQADLAEMKQNGIPHIHSLEELLGATLQHDGLEIKMMGFADRIDYRNGVYRVVDYKTGMVEGRELRFEPTLFPVDSKWSKALQLSFYKWAFCQKMQTDPSKVQAAIVSFRNMGKGYLYLNDKSSNDTFTSAFEASMSSVLSEMLNSDLAFSHRAESKYITV